MIRATAFALVAILVGGVVLSFASEAPPQPRRGMNIDPTADIHPSVILEGKVTVGPYTKIDAGTIITGNVTIGHHTLIRCNVTIRGSNTIGNYTHIYDNVNIEGGRPAKIGSSTAQVPDKSIIGDHCWINHGATMHGTQVSDGAAIGLNACCDYNTRLGKGAILANGSATRIEQVIPENSFVEGVPAIVKKQNITDDDRKAYFGLLPSEWTRYEAKRIEEDIRARRGSTEGAMTKPVTMQAVGVVHSPYKEAKGTPIQGVFGDKAEAWVELRENYVKGLKDLDGFSHAILLYHFHLSDKEEIVGKPYLEKEEHGVFAMRSPNRPNHIGLSIVRVKKIEGNRLYFTEVDVLDGTPVLDIKPYVKQFDSRLDAVSGWIERHFKDGKQPGQTKAE